MRKDSLDGTTAAAQAAAAWMVETASDAAAMSPLADALRDKSSPISQIPLESGFRDKMESVSRPLSRATGLNSEYVEMLV